MESDRNLVCCQCGAIETPQWREGPLGPKTLCNACGVKYYRQAKRTRKGAMGTGSRAKGRRARAITLSPKTKRAGGGLVDSSDEITTIHMHHSAAMSDSSEEMEERDAAMSLLCFAGMEPEEAFDSSSAHAEGCAQLQQQLLDGSLVAAIAKQEQAQLSAAAPAAATSTSSAIAASLASGCEDSSAEAMRRMSSLAALLSTQQLPGLMQLQAALQQAYKDAEAAEAATEAVAKFLAEKQEEAIKSRLRVQIAEHLLFEEMRQAEALALEMVAQQQAQQQQQLQQAQLPPAPMQQLAA